MTFQVGQKVVCILDGWPPRPSVIWPSKNTVYTIRELLDEGAEPSLRVYEILNPPMEFANVTTREPAFVCWAFRPVVEHKTDISIFTAMLNPSKHGVDA